jgi:8-hydroxy-5-deazaflavin:NADPH oxidoreductase
MKIGIFGTGIVGQTLAGALAAKGHDVMIGTRDPEATMQRESASGATRTPFRDWHAQHQSVKLGTFTDAARFGETIINATSGGGAMPALEGAGAEALGDKILLDLSNPLDFSKGFPPTLTVCNTDSLAEQLQRELPEIRLVKMFNTMANEVMVNPRGLGEDSTIFLAGNDPAARQTAASLAADLGWTDVFDLGDLTAARGLEMYLPLWTRIYSLLGRPDFNIKVVR